MKKVILLIAVIAATTLTTFAFTSQNHQNATVNTEVTGDEYVPVDIKDLPVQTRILVLEAFEGFEIKAIYQNVETQLLKIVVVKDEVEYTFLQTEDGKFVSEVEE
jgi:L-asparagine transporter-like permease